MSCQLFDAIGEIGERIRRAPHLLLCLDFDGTLAPIVDEPSLACLSPQMRRALVALAGHECLSLAVISGRDRADLQARVGIPGLIYAANHGLEVSGNGFIFVEPTAAACTEDLKKLAEDLAMKLQAIAGAFVEDKGLTLSVHYRLAAASDGEEVRRLVHATLARADHPFHLTMGDKVYEVRPRVYWNKGTAVAWIQEQLGKPSALVIYLGDDATDEDAFVAFPEAITVKVGDASETAANFQVEGQSEVRRFLEWLASLLPQEPLCVAASESTRKNGPAT